MSVLERDKVATKAVFDWFDRNYGLMKYRDTMKTLELSCHGIPWLALPVAMVYVTGGSDSRTLDLWMNLLLYLLLDIVFVSVLKAISRRRRPVFTQQADMFFTRGVDKFSFPSGHASRAVGLGFFFVCLYPLRPAFLTAPAVLTWSAAVAVSRVLLGRHHVLDVVAGCALGFFEYVVMSMVWMSADKALYWYSFLNGQDPWAG